MEQDMYPVLKRYFESLDFSVRAEVRNVDLVAKKDDLLLLVELKEQLNTSLMAQGIKRSRLGELVYLAIPRPSKRVLRSKLFKDKCLILKHLELGLLLVDVKSEKVEVMLDPKHYQKRTLKKKKQALLKEFTARKTRMNIGGVSKTKIITAYKELALLTLYYMEQGHHTTRELRALTNRKKVVSILQKNYYGWFVRRERGVYDVTDLGRNALKDYAEVIKEIRKEESDEST